MGAITDTRFEAICRASLADIPKPAHDWICHHLNNAAMVLPQIQGLIKNHASDLDIYQVDVEKINARIDHLLADLKTVSTRGRE